MCGWSLWWLVVTSCFHMMLFSIVLKYPKLGLTNIPVECFNIKIESKLFVVFFGQCRGVSLTNQVSGLVLLYIFQLRWYLYNHLMCNLKQVDLEVKWQSEFHILTNLWQRYLSGQTWVGQSWMTAKMTVKYWSRPIFRSGYTLFRNCWIKIFYESRRELYGRNLEKL